MTWFADRLDAGDQLAAALEPLVPTDGVVLGLPRGGVPVAAVVAARLGLPLDVLLVRKLGVPWHPELAAAAIGEDDVVVRNAEVLHFAGIDEQALAEIERQERAILLADAARIRAVHHQVPLAGRTAVVVDDGIATGATAKAACQVARARGARRVIIAAPVAAAESVHAMRDVADDVACVYVPAPGDFGGVSRFYGDFSPVTDDAVLRALRGG